jgi:alkylation response protein AidB-like acyl-CoA dehydrogenase
VISFKLTEEQEVVRDSMREFAGQELQPIARECDETSSIPSEFLESAWQLGLAFTQIPEEFGGGGERSPITNALILEELASGDAALAVAAYAPSAFVNAIVDQGSQAQKAQYLPAFCGESFTTAALASLEPFAMADPANPKAVAEEKEDRFVISGRKSFVLFGDRATDFLVTARNGNQVDAFIVPRDTAGVTVSQPELNMGMKGLTTVSLDLERVEVSAGNRLGEEAGSDVRRLLDNSRVALSAVMLGLSRSVLDFCVPYTKDRVAFDEPISKKQSIAFRMAEMHSEIEAMRWLTWKAASQLEQGIDATRSAYFAHSYAAEKSMWIADNGVQILGGHGFIREHPVEMWFRHARTISVLEGTIAL